jgi:RNA polymerase sigma-70 factor (ECF subfamily)
MDELLLYEHDLAAELDRGVVLDVGFEDFFRLHEARVGRYLVQITRDRALADDLLQETFLAAFRDRERIPPAGRAQTAWILGVAHHRALHALRGMRRGREAFASLTVTRRRSAPASDAFAMRDLLIRTLAPLDRSIVLLCLVHGYTSDEAADIVGLRPDGVRQRLSRSRVKLEHALKEAGRDA